ncbi:hypothetical protein WDH52_10865 [Streptomyces sp. TRM70308]|uniref:hypothetical protein n=1 Tax=Streptomyces sp. TRM70308 TaxID=3131932 RepID=UPI003D07C909
MTVVDHLKWALALALLTGAAGCASGNEQYAVPERVCGVPMDENVVRAVLPEGERLSQGGETLPETYNICTLLVDGSPAVRMSFSKETEYYHPLEEYAREFQDGEDIALDFPGNGGLDDENATIIVKCGLPERPNIISHMQVPPPGGATTDVSRADLERFAVDYMAGAKRELGCPD